MHVTTVASNGYNAFEALVQFTLGAVPLGSLAETEYDTVDEGTPPDVCCVMLAGHEIDGGK